MIVAIQTRSNLERIKYAIDKPESDEKFIFIYNEAWFVAYNWRKNYFAEATN